MNDSLFPPKQIIVQFSASVIVTGTPALKLETGVADREASWVNTTKSNSSAAEDGAVALVVDFDDTMLLFEYIVVTGDSADDLDYWSDEEVPVKKCLDLQLCLIWVSEKKRTRPRIRYDSYVDRFTLRAYVRNKGYFGGKRERSQSQ